MEEVIGSIPIRSTNPINDFAFVIPEQDHVSLPTSFDCRIAILDPDWVPRVNCVRRDFHDFIAYCQVPEHFDLTIECLASLDGHPLSLAVPHSNDEGVLLVAGHCRRRDEQCRIPTLKGP